LNNVNITSSKLTIFCTAKRLLQRLFVLLRTQWDHCCAAAPSCCGVLASCTIH